LPTLGTSLADFTPSDRRTSIALGFFDGFHRGHQAILGATVDSAYRALTYTFRNHPASVISSNTRPGLLTTAAERFQLLEQAGTQVIWSDFDRPFSQLSPSEFFHDILVSRLQAARLISGENYRFGHRAGGDVATLRQLAAPLGIEVITVSGVFDEGELISSTRIRRSVENGLLEEATRMLGRPFSVCAQVQRGDQRGRQLGFPTANLPLPADKLVPAFGVYACQVERSREPGKLYPAVANLGVRPTVTTEGEPLLEAHLLDFAEDLYGESLRVDLVKFLRAERRFSGLDELKAQIGRDSHDARTHLLRSS
jgi:riboflavin kinase / FMN adenylyltransferase